jgi:hypothetical protein
VRVSMPRFKKYEAGALSTYIFPRNAIFCHNVRFYLNYTNTIFVE